MAEANIYIRAGLQARKIGGRWALCRTDINWAEKESEIDRGQFDHEKSAYWKARFAAFTPQEKLQIYMLLLLIQNKKL